MQILIVLTHVRERGGVRLLVRLPHKDLCQRVTSLVAEDRSREASDLVVNKGEVEHYLSSGTRLSVSPDLTFIEDLL